MPRRTKARNARSPHVPNPPAAHPSDDSQLASGRRPASPTSDEEFVLDDPDESGCGSEDDLPVRRTGGLPDMPVAELQINDPTAFGKKEEKKTEYDFFFEWQGEAGKKDSKRKCRYCT